MRRHVPPFRRGNVLKRLGNSRGSLLILSYLFIATVLLWGVAGFGQSTVAVNASERYRGAFQAFHLAEAALDEAIAQVRTGSTSNVAMTSMATGTYWSTVSELSGSPSGTYQIQAFGQVSGIQQQVEAVIRRSALFRWGLFGIDEVELQGSVLTDSYNSSQGTYAQTLSTNGDIGTNSIQAAHLHLQGSVLVKGDLLVGPTGNPNTVIHIEGSAVVTGTQQAAVEATSFSTPEVPPGVTNQGNLLLAGSQTLTLSEGTYWYNSIRTDDSATIQTTGAVKIYVSDSVDLRGSSVVGANVPADFSIQVLGDADVKLDGSTQLTGTIYAPNAEVRLDGFATVYGAIVAEELDFRGSASIHYDEVLADQSAPPGTSYTVTLRSWRVP